MHHGPTKEEVVAVLDLEGAEVVLDDDGSILYLNIPMTVKNTKMMRRVLEHY